MSRRWGLSRFHLFTACPVCVQLTPASVELWGYVCVIMARVTNNLAADVRIGTDVILSGWQHINVSSPCTMDVIAAFPITTDHDRVAPVQLERNCRMGKKKCSWVAEISLYSYSSRQRGGAWQWDDVIWSWILSVGSTVNQYHHHTNCTKLQCHVRRAHP